MRQEEGRFLPGLSSRCFLSQRSPRLRRQPRKLIGRSPAERTRWDAIKHGHPACPSALRWLADWRKEPAVGLRTAPPKTTAEADRAITSRENSVGCNKARTSSVPVGIALVGRLAEGACGGTTNRASEDNRGS